MAETLNIPRESTMQDIAKSLHTIAVAQAGAAAPIETFADVKQIVAHGFGPLTFPVGTQLKAQHATLGEIVFDVVAHNHHKAPGNEDAPTMTLLMHDCVYSRMMDNIEALYRCVDPLPAGTYHFTLLAGWDVDYGGGKTLQFTIGKQVPAGGVIMFNWAYQAQATAGTISTYNTQTDTAALETVSVSEGSGGTNLGTADGKSTNMNHGHRARYGSNNYLESAARQWLNSKAAANTWWKPQTVYDRPPAYANVAGFLAGFDDDFLRAVGPVDITTARNTVYENGGDTGGSYVTRDTFFPISMTEVGLGANNSIQEGSTLEFYAGAGEADRIKYDITAKTTARYWWLRSPSPSHANNVRYLTPAGALSNYVARNGNGLAAACVIY